MRSASARDHASAWSPFAHRSNSSDGFSWTRATIRRALIRSSSDGFSVIQLTHSSIVRV